MKICKIAGGITAAYGFSAACCEAAIKYPNRKDMAMVFADVPCAVAGTFTSNKVKAAPVLWNMDIVKNGKPCADIVIAENAGAETLTAAKDLQEHLRLISGATLAIVPSASKGPVFADGFAVVPVP